MNAAIDVGSNSIRMLIGNVCLGAVEPLLYRRRITRLAGGLTSSHRLFSPHAMEESLAALQTFVEVAASQRCQSIRAVATEALRRADNASDFVQRAQNRTGLNIEIVTGVEEASLSAAGARSALMPLPDCYLLFDIGGGSSEFLLQQGENTLYQRSFPLGVVSLAEAYSTASARNSVIRSTLKEIEFDLQASGLLSLLKSDKSVLVGTAGTVTTLAAMKLEMSNYDWRRINNLQLDRTYLLSLQHKLNHLSPVERESLPGMEPRRGDLILPGLEIVLGVLQAYDKESLKVSDFGLLEGVLLSL